MLKITQTIEDGQRTLFLEGKLVDPWLKELERTWNESHQAGVIVMVDLKDVTAISERGEEVLRAMMADGAKFNCCRGVFTKHVLAQLLRTRATSGNGKEAAK